MLGWALYMWVTCFPPAWNLNSGGWHSYVEDFIAQYEMFILKTHSYTSHWMLKCVSGIGLGTEATVVNN